MGVKSHHGNPYDGHTLKDSLTQAEKMADDHIKDAFCDRGFRGHNYLGDVNIHIVGTKHNVGRSLRNLFRRRNAIEPVIGHLKSDNRLNRNYLKGIFGDNINALLCGCGFNLRKLIAAFFLLVRILRNLLIKFSSIFPDNLISVYSFFEF